jgi:hypothetical protein
MGAKSRTKGAAFELEVAKMLDENLGWELKRNLEQYQVKGQGDLNGKKGVMIECKRYATVAKAQVKKWWDESLAQAEQEAKKTGETVTPVLIYRADRAKPVAVVQFGLLRGIASAANFDQPVELDMDLFFEVARDDLCQPKATS